MSLKALMVRVTHRGSRRSSKVERALADARANAALKRRKQSDQTNLYHATGSGFGGGVF